MRTYLKLSVIGLVCLFFATVSASPQQPESVTVRLAVIEEHLRGLETALQLQATEYERRLDALNHAHEKQVDDQGTYLAKDSFEATLKGWSEWRERLESRLTLIEGRDLGAEGFRTTLVSNALALISIVGFIFMFVTRRREPPRNKEV